MLGSRKYTIRGTRDGESKYAKI